MAGSMLSSSISWEETTITVKSHNGEMMGYRPDNGSTIPISLEALEAHPELCKAGTTHPVVISNEKGFKEIVSLAKAPRPEAGIQPADFSPTVFPSHEEAVELTQRLAHEKRAKAIEEMIAIKEQMEKLKLDKERVEVQLQNIDQARREAEARRAAAEDQKKFLEEQVRQTTMRETAANARQLEMRKSLEKLKLHSERAEAQVQHDAMARRAAEVELQRMKEQQALLEEQKEQLEKENREAAAREAAEIERHLQVASGTWETAAGEPIYLSEESVARLNIAYIKQSSSVELTDIRGHTTSVPVAFKSAPPSARLQFAAGKRTKLRFVDCNPLAVWECNTDEGWKPYKDVAISQLENAYLDGAPRDGSGLQIIRDKFTYRIDFTAMQQINERTGKRRDIRRRMVKKTVRTSGKEGPMDAYRQIPERPPDKSFRFRADVHADVHMYRCRHQKEINGAESLHYALAKTQFESMLGMSTQHIMHGRQSTSKAKIDLWVNPHVADRFFRQKEEFKRKGLDGEVIWVFHGTDKPSVNSIMIEGFKVGGREVGIANGDAYGTGVYTATGPHTPMTYSKGSDRIILAMAVRGRHRQASTGAADLDSWCPRGDWIIFNSPAQLLPMYVVHY